MFIPLCRLQWVWCPFCPFGYVAKQCTFCATVWVFERGTLIKDITLYLTILVVVVVLHHVIHDVL